MQEITEINNISSHFVLFNLSSNITSYLAVNAANHKANRKTLEKESLTL